MQKSSLSAVRPAAFVLTGLGLLLLARWSLPGSQAWMPPGSELIGLMPAVLFFVAAYGLIHVRGHLQAGSAHVSVPGASVVLALAIVPALHLWATLGGPNLGLDFPSIHLDQRPSRGGAGRMSPNACLAFMLSAGAMWLLQRQATSWVRRATVACIAAVLLIGLGGLAGHFLGLETLHRVSTFHRLLPASAVGFVVLGAGLWALHEFRQPFDAAAAARRITRRTSTVVVLLAVASGIAGFSLMRDTFEEQVARTMLLTTATTASALSQTLASALWYPRTLSTRPTVIRSMAALASSPQDPEALAALQEIARSLSSADVAHVRFSDPLGGEITSLGASTAAKAVVAHQLAPPNDGATLAWVDGGYVLHTRKTVTRADGTVSGSITTEQPLRQFDTLLHQLRHADPSSDAIVCAPIPQGSRCGPTRFRREAFTLQATGTAGLAADGIRRALLGERGVGYARDSRGVEVLSSFAPIQAYGLALGAKTDVQALYAPLRSRLLGLALAMTGVIGLALYVLRSQVRPVLQRLAQSEQKMKSILDDQSELVSLARVDGTLTYVNRSYAQHFDRTPEGMVGTNLFDHVDPSDRGAVREKIALAVATGVPTKSENRMAHPHDQTRWLAWTNSIQREPGGELLVHSVGRDVTQRRAAEAAQRELTAVFDNTTDYVIQTDWKGYVSYLNPAARRVLGLAPDDRLEGRHFREFNTQETTDLLAHSVTVEVKAKGIWLGETTFRAADGTVIPVSHMVIGHRDDSGRICRYSGIMRDITKDKAALRAQQVHAATLSSVAESIPAVVAVVGADRRYRFANSRALRWMMRPPESVIGHRVEDVLGGDYERSAPWIERALAGEAVNFTRDYPEHGQTRHMSVTYVPIFAESGNVEAFVGVVQDITDQKREEIRLIRLAQRDPLTGLLNRMGFQAFLEASSFPSEAQSTIALLYIDLDHFKPVNDLHGHAVGDEVLQQFAARLSASVRPTDAVARIGGDEFAVALVDVRDGEAARAVAEKIVKASAATFVVREIAVNIGASVGVAVGDPGSVDWRDLVELADARLYHAKATGKGRQA